MDEQNSKKDTPKENDPARLVTDSDKKVNYAEKEGRSGQSNSGQTDYCIWGLPWPQFVSAIIAFLAVTVAIGTAGLRWYADMSSQDVSLSSQDLIKQKQRARIVPRTEWIDDPFSLSLIFKNMGESVALNTYGVWLAGECLLSTPEQCAAWCFQPLPKTDPTFYGPLAPQEEYRWDFTHTPPPRKKRKGTQEALAPSYFCGYFAYTDVFCMHRHRFRCLYYEPASGTLRYCAVGNEEQETQGQDCRP